MKLYRCVLNIRLTTEKKPISFKDVFAYNTFIKDGIYFIKKISVGLVDAEMCRRPHLPNYALIRH